MQPHAPRQSMPPDAVIEQPAGPDLLPSIDLAAMDQRRKLAYQSYESFLRNQLLESDRQRPSRWQRDYRSIEHYLASIATKREALRDMFGWWVPPADRVPLDIAEEEVLHEEAGLIARRFSFEIMSGLRTYAIEMYDRSRPCLAGLVAQHGYAGAPETVCGFGPGANEADHSYRSMGLRAAKHGFHVVAVHHPTAYGQPQRMAMFPLQGHEELGYTYGKNRLHRLATLAGGTLFGLDLLASSRAIDILERRGFKARQIGMYGLSQGGQTALYLPAIDQRIHASVSACYFNHRLRKLIGPVRGTAFLDTPTEDKFFRQVISLFADSDVVSLIAPRAFAVEAGRLDSAVDVEQAWMEYQFAAEHYQQLGMSNRLEFIVHAQGHVCATERAMEFLKSHLA